MNNIFDSIDEKKLAQAISIVKEIIGPTEAARLEKSFSEQKGKQLASGLSQNDIATVKTFIDNPELLRKVLSTPQGKQIIRKFAK
ncbi:MAG: hypothetical protein E7477_06935 [Ruminococcaceae bacterium]|nr:hypothetical protein [Oscillospiraceae bacterium]